MSLTLKELPSPGAEYLKALRTLTRKPKGEIKIPALECRIADIGADVAQLKAYREVCGFSSEAGLPITYPHVRIAALHMHLLTQPEFPLPLLGLVHLRNRITQTRQLTADERFDVRVHTGEGRQTDKGLEFDIWAHYTDAKAQEVWTGETTVLFRNRSTGGGAKRPPAPADSRISDYATINAPADLGRRYGRIAGDMNPIHLYAATAKLFGFPRAIAHGMWSLARCAALTEPKLAQPPRELSVQFKQPLLLPGRAALKYIQNGAGFEYSLLGASGGKVHLSGFIA